MNIATRLSAKGQVVLPKATRDRLGLKPGDVLDVIEQAGGVTLRPRPPAETGPTAAEVFARIRQILPYHGPRIDDDEIEAAILTAIDDRHGG